MMIKGFFEYLYEDLGHIEYFTIEKGLSSKDAYKKALPKVKGDFRGFSYNPKTGRCKFI